MASLQDKIYSLVPKHIIENHPRFVDFLKAYYEWLSQEGNPYNAIKHHMDYMNFKKSMDAYTDLMKKEYLANVPEEVLIDKELFIKWSKKFNMARGSHDSYKFLFRVLFNEDDIQIYLPKKNILRTSDGTWTSGENVILVTNSSTNQNKFLYQRIVQRRQVYEDIYEYAYATVQKVRNKYAGRYIVTELYVANIEGEFKEGYPIENESGDFEWPIPTISRLDVSEEGSGYQEGQRIQFDNFEEFVVSREADISGEFDTRITSYLKPEDVSVNLNGVLLNGYRFDGRTIMHEDISEGDALSISMPSYEGYYVIDQIDNDGSIVTTNLLDASIGYPENKDMYIDGVGQNAHITAFPGILKPESGRFLDELGWLSSNMYLQDSRYYQEYSYVIKTQQNIEKYGEIVKELLHPAGFAMFGNLSIIQIIELLIDVISFDIEIQTKQTNIVSDYGLGPNYAFLDRFKHGLSERLYRFMHVKDHDIEMTVGDEKYGRGNAMYDYNGAYRNILDVRGSINGEYIDMGYFVFDYISDVPDNNSNVIVKGWMTKDNLSDYYLYVPQQYSEEKDSGDTYFETGYASPRN